MAAEVRSPGMNVYPGAQHEVLNEINKDEVLDDVARFLRGALGLRPSS